MHLAPPVVTSMTLRAHLGPVNGQTHALREQPSSVLPRFSSATGDAAELRTGDDRHAHLLLEVNGMHERFATGEQLQSAARDRNGPPWQECRDSEGARP